MENESDSPFKEVVTPNFKVLGELKKPITPLLLRAIVPVVSGILIGVIIHKTVGVVIGISLYFALSAWLDSRPDHFLTTLSWELRKKLRGITAANHIYRSRIH